MKVGILGAGAIGCALGAALSPHAEVHLVARGGHLSALRSRGLELDGRVLPMQAHASLPAGMDLVIAATKTQDLEAALASASDALGGATVLTIQNGLAAEDIASRHAKDIIGCVTAIDAELLEPGVVRVGRVGGLVLGRAEGAADARVRELVALLRSAGLPARASDDLAGARWTKLLVNLNNAMLAATGLTAQEAFARRDLPRLSLRIVREGLAVARAEGIRLERIPWADPRQVRLVAALPEAIAARLLSARVLRDAGDVPLRGSTLQSILRGRDTEVGFLNGEVVSRGARLGVPTPVNGRLVRAVREVSRSGKFVAPADLAA